MGGESLPLDVVIKVADNIFGPPQSSASFRLPNIAELGSHTMLILSISINSELNNAACFSPPHPMSSMLTIVQARDCNICTDCSIYFLCIEDEDDNTNCMFGRLLSLSCCICSILIRWREIQSRNLNLTRGSSSSSANEAKEKSSLKFVIENLTRKLSGDIEKEENSTLSLSLSVSTSLSFSLVLSAAAAAAPASTGVVDVVGSESNFMDIFVGARRRTHICLDRSLHSSTENPAASIACGTVMVESFISSSTAVSVRGSGWRPGRAMISYSLI